MATAPERESPMKIIISTKRIKLSLTQEEDGIHFEVSKPYIEDVGFNGVAAYEIVDYSIIFDVTLPSLRTAWAMAKMAKTKAKNLPKVSVFRDKEGIHFYVKKPLGELVDSSGRGYGILVFKPIIEVELPILGTARKDAKIKAKAEAERLAAMDDYW